MRAASRLWLLVVALAAPSTPTSSTRVAVGLAHSGTVSGGQTLGTNPFAAPPTMSASDGAIQFAARLSGGTHPEAIFRMTGEGASAVVSLTSGTPSPYGAPHLEFLPPTTCGGWSAFWTRLAAPEDSDEAIVVRGPSTAVGIARTGEAVPGGGTLTALGATPGLGSDGSVSFLALLDDAPSPALFLRDTAGTLTRLLAVEEDAPWAGGTTILDLGAPSRSCTGAVALVVTVLAQGIEEDLLVVGQPDALAPVLASGTAIDGTIIERLLGPAAPGPNGDWFLKAFVTPAGSEAVIRVPAGGPPELLARTGDATPVGGALAAIGPPCAWWPGRAAFRGTLASGAGLPAGAVRAALLGTGPSLESIVTPATPFSPDPLIKDLGDPSCIGDGRLAFTTQSNSGERVVRWSQGVLTSLAATGESSPASGRYLDGGLKTSRAALLDDGFVAFDGRLAAFDGRGAIMRASPGSPPTVWLAPGAAVEGAGVVLDVNGPPAALAGGVMVAATMSAPTPHAAYLHLIEGQPPAILLAVGEPAPIGGAFLSLGPMPAAIGGGALAFGASVTGGTAPVGLFIREPGGEVRALAVVGSSTSEQEALSSFSFAPVRAGNSRVAFRAVTATGVTGVWTKGSAIGSGPATALIRAGDPAPGGGTIVSVDEPTAGPEGSVALLASLDDGRTIALIAKDGQLRRAFATGDTVGGGAIEELRAVGVDASGAAIGSVTLTGSPETAVLRETGAGPEPLLIAGDPGPETVPGSSLGAFGFLGTHADGRISVAADLAGWSRGAAMILATGDGDADGRGDPVDCAPADGTVQALPGEVANLSIATVLSAPPGPAPALSLTWDIPAQPGGQQLSYDLLAGGLTTLRTSPFADASCAASGVALPGVTLQPASVSGDRWFLVRARNACGRGIAGSAPAPVDALACP